MLDINLFRIEKGGNPEIIKQSQIARFSPPEFVDDVINIYQKIITINYQMQQAKNKINILQQQIALKIKNKEEYGDLVKQKNEIEKNEMGEDKNILVNELTLKLNDLLQKIGNIVHPSVPIGMDEANNLIIKVHGNKPVYNFKPKGYPEMMKLLGIVDTEKGSTIAGHRGYFLKDYGVLLNQALINYGLFFLKKKGYVLLQPPFYMFKDVISKTVQLSDYDENLYKLIATGAVGTKNNNDIITDDKYLIATSEQPISAYHQNEIIPENDLPIKYCGISTCFRKEAGASGKDVQGIFRVHQFEKVEQFCITKPENSWDMFEQMIKISEEFYQSLGLHYQIVSIVSGALNNAAAKKYDLEAWFPETNRFRELVSCSNCTNYQSVSMNIKFKRNVTNNKEYVHCLNSTLCATERTLCCLAETYQTENGMIIPEVLQPFIGTDFIPYKK